jgi:hypothetical protein
LVKGAASSGTPAPDGLGYPELAANIVAYMTAWHMLKTKGGAVHRAVLPGLRFAGLSTRAARRHSRRNDHSLGIVPDVRSAMFPAAPPGVGGAEL